MNKKTYYAHFHTKYFMNVINLGLEVMFKLKFFFLDLLTRDKNKLDSSKYFNSLLFNKSWICDII